MSKILYTLTDEAPFLATASFLPIVQAYAGTAGVAVETRVQIRRANAEAWGTARNLSRGGIFVEAEAPVAPGAEVALEFTLPETTVWLSPTAEVVWRRESHGELPAGLGLRFLALDGASARQIDSYVYERARHPGDRPAAPAGGAQ